MTGRGNTYTHTLLNSLSALGECGSKPRRLKSRHLATLMYDAYTPESYIMLYNLTVPVHINYFIKTRWKG